MQTAVDYCTAIDYCTAKKNKILHDLLESEPYFKAIATNDYIEIKNCLSDMKTAGQKSELQTMRFEIGLILACFCVDDKDIFEQILLTVQFCNLKESLPLTKVNIQNLLTQNENFEFLNVLIGHNLANYSIEEIVPELYVEKNNYVDKIFNIIGLLQTYYHLKRINNLKKF